MKIGIISLFNNNNNYGGILQSYALTMFLKNNNYTAEQICVYKQNSYHIEKNVFKKIHKFISVNKLNIIQVTFNKTTNYMTHMFYDLLIKKSEYIKINNRLMECKKFRENLVPHSSKKFSNFELNEIDDYDIYVVGSDQIWHTQECIDNVYLNPAYWLDFKNAKNKIAYAASPSIENYPDNLKQAICKCLVDFKAISIREKSALSDLLSTYNKFSENHVVSKALAEKTECVLDPVFLLNKQEWEALCDDKFNINEKYVFAYLLGSRDKERGLIKKYCKEYGYKLITFPYLLGRYRKCDKTFADINVFEGPAAFLTLIKNASVVFTDSFHATAFSILFNTEFYCLSRISESYSTNNDRINDLLDIVDCQDRYITDNLYNDFIWTNNKLNYSDINNKIMTPIKNSRNFLLNSIKNI